MVLNVLIRNSIPEIILLITETKCLIFKNYYIKSIPIKVN